MAHVSTLGGRGDFQGVAQPCGCSPVLMSLTQAIQCFLQDMAGIITLLTFYHQSMSPGLAFLKGAGGAATTWSEPGESNTHSGEQQDTEGSRGTQWGAVF